ncbi:P-loop containing nucleoside triphosphate hydrolase protein [Morchella snyderi]|nr:P-loop containing nucleoside triphosphate hydrolase protein [Morchella snyderi]
MFEAIANARKNIASFGRKLIEIGQFLAGFSDSPTRENDTVHAVSLNVHHSHDHNHKHVYEGGEDDRVRRLEARCLEMEEMIRNMKAKEDSLRAERINGERVKTVEDRNELKGSGLKPQEEGKKVDEDGISPEVWPTMAEKLKAERMLRFRSDLYAFAVAGISGVGKSSLINVFLGEKIAATGAVETTTKINRYPEPGQEAHRRSNVWYDIPGAGTLEIPGWQYFNQQCLFIFDLIIVVIGDRFTETDVQILKHCKRFRIPSILVRSKADQHISNMMADLQDVHNKVPKPQRVLYQQCRMKFIAQTHASVDAQLRLSGLPPQRVFIVSTRGQAFGKAYAELGNVMTVGMDDLALREEMEKFIDEVDLISEILTTARNRRCEQIGIGCASLATGLEAPVPKYDTSLPTLEANLIRNLRNGSIDDWFRRPLSANGERVYKRCPCGYSRQSVEHILKHCTLLSHVRDEQSMFWAVAAPTLDDLLCTEAGTIQTGRIWSAFMEYRDAWNFLIS